MHSPCCGSCNQSSMSSTSRVCLTPFDSTMSTCASTALISHQKVHELSQCEVYLKKGQQYLNRPNEKRCVPRNVPHTAVPEQIVCRRHKTLVWLQLTPKATVWTRVTFTAS